MKRQGNASTPLGGFWVLLLAAILGLGTSGRASATVTPPDLTVCDNADCTGLPESVCSSGFKITLTGVDPANFTTNGSATYHYQICDAHLSACPVDSFHGLSHFDLTFPKLGDGCLSSTTNITGSCTAVDNTPGDGDPASVGAFGRGDSSCFAKTCGGVQGSGATGCRNDADCSGGEKCITGGSNFVAKCDAAHLNAGDCINMAITIAGELTDVGAGAMVVVDKEANQCTGSCMFGPSCDTCAYPPPPDGEACLTRTIGFWGTHPWVTNNYTPVTVCGQALTCDGADDGKSNPSCGYGTCNDVMEGLGSNPGQEGGKNGAYIVMVKQLTAAKLNLAATAQLLERACSSWTYGGKSISEWLAICDAPLMCGAGQATINASGCIAALNEFNNSQDVGITETPTPFDRPSVDDHGNTSGADSSAFTGAQGNNKKTKLVIGKGSCAL